MIRIEVEEYCQQCLDFTPDVTPPTRAISVDGKPVMQTDTIVQCKYRRRCAGIKRYLDQQMRGDAQGMLLTSPMICGLNIYWTKDELPDNYSFAILHDDRKNRLAEFEAIGMEPEELKKAAELYRLVKEKM